MKGNVKEGTGSAGNRNKFNCQFFLEFTRCSLFVAAVEKSIEYSWSEFDSMQINRENHLWLYWEELW